MRVFVLVLLCTACSSSAAGEPSTWEDSAVIDDATPVDSTPDHAGLPDIKIDTSDTPPHNPAGDCPACQASKCMPQIEACAGSEACVTWLKCMNDCFAASDPATCQAGCTKKYPSTQGAALAACNDAKCHVECTP